MGVKSILFIILLVVFSFFIVSCTYKQEIKPSIPKVYIVEEPQPKIFVIGEEGSLEWIGETKESRHEQNTRRFLDEYKDEQEEFKIRTKLKNVRRLFKNEFDEMELITGFDKELDNPKFKKVGSK